jgi:hypothetical protein
VLGIAGDQPSKTLSKRLDDHVGDWSLSRETGASLCYVVGPKAMGAITGKLGRQLDVIRNSVADCRSAEIIPFSWLVDRIAL